jgi:hypothetical protein
MALRWYRHRTHSIRYSNSHAESVTGLQNQGSPHGPSAGPLPPQRKSFFSPAAGLINRLSHPEPRDPPSHPGNATDDEKRFQKLAGRKMPSQFTSTGEGPQERDFRLQRTRSDMSESSFYRDSGSTQWPAPPDGTGKGIPPLFAERIERANSRSFTDQRAEWPPRRPANHPLLRASPGAASSTLASSTDYFGNELPPAAGPETLMPGPARTPHITGNAIRQQGSNSPPNPFGSRNASPAYGVIPSPRNQSPFGPAATRSDSPYGPLAGPRRKPVAVSPFADPDPNPDDKIEPIRPQNPFGRH